MQTTSFYWYDYETTGLQAGKDRVIQFAGLRTNLDLEPIAEPQMFYCRLTPDYLPSPEACLVTGISPQTTLKQGLSEPEFIDKINQEMSMPGTCVLGYNNLSFDDEFTRNLLYRNFFEPYAREYGEGRSRWDILNMVRMTAALRPEGITWPTNDKGLNIFKLTDLTTANQISHEHAHDALGDVYATLAMAKLIKNAQPQLFDYLFNQIRDKMNVKDLLYKTQAQQDFCIYTSTQLPRQQAYTSAIYPIGAHPWDNNRVLAFDLMQDPSILFSHSAEQLQQALFAPEYKNKRPKGLCSIKVNACPALAPKGVLNPEASARLGIDLARCGQHLAQISADSSLLAKLQQVFDQHYPEESDPELAIYQGFLKPADKKRCAQVRQSTPEQLGKNFQFADKRLPTLLWRYRARHYPEHLSPAEQQEWQAFCRQRLGLDDGQFDLYLQGLEDLLTKHPEPKSQQVLTDLHEYAQQLAQQFHS